MSQVFHYIIDISVADHFEAHVEDHDGHTVFEITSEMHLRELIGDHTMRSEADVTGLFNHLIEQRIICDNDMLVSNEPLVIA